jgi:epoxyqueuosine reductase
VLTAAGIKAHARTLGFDLCGIAAADAYPELGLYDERLARFSVGTMEYLRRTAERRRDVRAVMPSARSVIVTGTVYNTARPYSTAIADRTTARIARYAWGDDYHEVIGSRLDALVGWMRERAPEPFEARWYVDTGPVQERVYAQYAGLGWVGKNTCLIHPRLGSWLFLSEIITSLALEPDVPSTDQCGSCTRCLEACPTGALVEARAMDPVRCLSYLTIEHKTSIPDELRGALGQHVYGCDICQDVCPWNRSAPTSGDAAWQPRPGLDGVQTRTLFAHTDDTLTALLRRSAMKRAGVRRLRRNLAVALGNGDAADRATLLTGSLHDEGQAAHAPTLGDALVREHAAWAARQIDGGRPETDG